MASISDLFVSVSIESISDPVERADFSTALVLLGNGNATNEVSEYTSSSDVATDFGEGSTAYYCAKRLFAQSPSPKKILIAETTAEVEQSIDVDVLTAVVGETTGITVIRPDGTTHDYSYTTLSGNTTSTIATALAALIDTGETGYVNASAASAKITLAGVAGLVIYYTDFVNLGNYIDNTEDPGYEAVLNSLLDVNDSFYGFVVDAGSQEIIETCASWAESNNKFFSAQLTGAADLSASPTAVALHDAAYTRTTTVHHSAEKSHDRIDVAVLKGLSYRAGTVNYSGMTFKGVAADKFTATQRAYLKSVKVNMYTKVGADARYFYGYVSSGTYIDETVTLDALTEDIKSNLLSFLFGASLIPMNDHQIAAVVGNIQATLESYSSDIVPFLFRDTIVISFPKASEISSDDRAGRILRNITFSAQKQGAINEIQNVLGTVTF